MIGLTTVFFHRQFTHLGGVDDPQTAADVHAFCSPIAANLGLGLSRFLVQIALPMRYLAPRRAVLA